jgi:hypothetical protein
VNDKPEAEILSVELEWEIEDAETPLPDVTPMRARRRYGCRRWIRLAALVTLLAAAGTGYLWLKIRERRTEF